MLPAIANAHNGRLVAIASRDPARAAQMAEPYPSLQVVETYDAVLDDKQVDAVYIPLVNRDHKPWTIRALRAGKHVLCEKPLAMNADEAEEMAGTADAANVRLMEAFMYRFHPAMRAFVETARDALHVRASFGFKLKDEANYRREASLGGGALLDVGCYAVSVSRWILGEPVDVLARSHSESGVDMSTTALLAFDGGRTASVWASFESTEEQELTVITRDRVFRREQPFTARGDPHDPYQLMVESFADSVLFDRPVAIPTSESVANMRVLDRIRAAASQSGVS